MPGKKHAALNRFFTQCYVDEEAKLPQKFGHFQKKKDFYFYVSTIVGLSKGVPGQIANVTNAFLLNTVQLGFSGYFLPLNTYLKFYKVSFGGPNERADLLPGNRH